MAVYVDELRVWTTRPPFHGGSCHLTADTLDELHQLAERIGLQRSWFQPRSSPHYDLTPAKRDQALNAGAVFVSGKEQAWRRVEARRSALAGGPSSPPTSPVAGRDGASVAPGPRPDRTENRGSLASLRAEFPSPIPSRPPQPDPLAARSDGLSPGPAAYRDIDSPAQVHRVARERALSAEARRPPIGGRR